MKIKIDREGSDQHVRKWGVFLAVSLVFCFLNLSTFTSLGVVLYTMVGELHWSMTAAGFNFTLLGLACGLSSPFAALAMKWFGCRATICAGTLLLFAGFLIAAKSHSLGAFYIAMVLLGCGYSLAGNVPGIALIATWFERGSSRVIGMYLMLGALGAASGPPVVQAIVSAGGWRGHWQVMCWAAAAIGLVCFALVREVGPKAIPHVLAIGEVFTGAKTVAADGWSPRAAVMTSQFLLVSAAMAATMACVTTINSVVVPHLVKLGSTPGAAAYVLSAIGLTATLIKGGAGHLCERLPATMILAAGLGLQAVGCFLLGFADTGVLHYASALAFGTGWGLGYVAGTVVLLAYFGADTGSKILSVVWLITTVAAAGPIAAGMIADRTGSFAPIFDIFAVMLLVLAVPFLVMREPVRRVHASAVAGRV